MDHGRTLVIANPAARHGETERLIPVISQLLANLPHDMRITDGIGHATELAAQANRLRPRRRRGWRRHRARGAQRPDAPPRRRLDPRSACCRRGQATTRARTLGVSDRPARRPHSSSRPASVTAFDVGVCNGVYFNNSFAAGLDAKVTAKTVEYKVTKERSGLWLYLSALLNVLFTDLNSVSPSDSLR